MPIDVEETTGKPKLCEVHSPMAKQSEEADHRPIRRLLRRLIAAPAAAALVFPILLFAGSYLGYSRWYKTHLESQFQGLAPTDLQVSDPNPFIEDNLVADVYRQTELGSLSAMDAEATVKVASAFSSNAWVKDVKHVQKLPGGKFKVELEYREPVAAFHITGSDEWKRKVERDLRSRGHTDAIAEGFYPLAGDGHMLPTVGYFSAEDMQALIHIEVKEVYPTGNAGTPFGDRRVESAALLAKLLSAVKDQVPVTKIIIDPDRRIMVPQLELQLQNGVTVKWGSPPGMEKTYERKAREKLKDLITGNYVAGSDLTIAAAPRSQYTK